MKGILYYLQGYADVEICGAATAEALNRLTMASVAFWNTQWVDPLTVRIRILQKDQNKADYAIQSALCDGKVIMNAGIKQSLGGLNGRWVLLFLLTVSVLGTLLIPQFVLFYEVEGNALIPDEQILQALRDLNIKFGTFGPDIDPRWIKNQLLNQIPELEWVTVTQNGCRAKVIVRERLQTPETESKKGFSNMIAAHGGIITGQSVLSGQAVRQVGDTVEEGDLLISGVVDLERVFALEPAIGEVFARTWRTSRTVIPASFTMQQESDDDFLCVWLIVGRKRIKIFGNSGISHGSCDKMKTKIEWTLPDDLKVPVSLEVERFGCYATEKEVLSEEEAMQILTDYVHRTVSQEMQAGQILNSTCFLKQRQECYELTASLECHEMIARTIRAKWNNEEVLND